jgi:hypothetical protein
MVKIELSIAEKAYIAGMIDADGCVGIYKKKSKAKAYEYDFGVRIIVTNTDFLLIEWLKKTLGCGCAYKNEYRYKPNWNTVHRYQLVGNQARLVLVEIIPFMIIKKERSTMCLSLPNQGRLGITRTQQEYTEQENLFMALKKMNKRGV